jgi:hypothetical protein
MTTSAKVLVWAIGTASLVMALVPAAHAQDATPLPEILVAPPSSASPSQPKATERNDQIIGHATGTNDKDGADPKAFERLNKQLKRKVDDVNPTVNAPPLDARSSDTKIGVINIPGVQQQYGQNFGHSAFPYRPPPPTFSGSLGGRR